MTVFLLSLLVVGLVIGGMAIGVTHGPGAYQGFLRRYRCTRDQYGL